MAAGPDLLVKPSPAMAPTPAAAGRERLSARHLAKHYRNRTVLRDVSLTVNRGEAVGLLGPNGAGKTTCFYIITGLIAADAGQVGGAPGVEGRDAHAGLQHVARKIIQAAQGREQIARHGTVAVDRTRAFCHQQVDVGRRVLTVGVADPAVDQALIRSTDRKQAGERCLRPVEELRWGDA